MASASGLPSMDRDPSRKMLVAAILVLSGFNAFFQQAGLELWNLVFGLFISGLLIAYWQRYGQGRSIVRSFIKYLLLSLPLFLVANYCSNAYRLEQWKFDVFNDPGGIRPFIDASHRTPILPTAFRVLGKTHLICGNYGFIPTEVDTTGQKRITVEISVWPFTRRTETRLPPR